MVRANISYEELKSQAEPLLKELLVGGTVIGLNFTDLYLSVRNQSYEQIEQLIQIHVGPHFAILRRKPRKWSLYRFHTFRSKEDLIKNLCELQADLIVDLSLLDTGDLVLKFRSGRIFYLSSKGLGNGAWMINTEDQEYFIVCQDGELAIIENLVR
ncbi:MAG: hypothetical protein PHD88_08295 [Firmicutes bacterium]|nr:hypothetical protein [Bacillota bacterium]MDD4694376.1 hypothetical protein [Bacillota bacterium]